jgi:hypothetical protein
MSDFNSTNNRYYHDAQRQALDNIKKAAELRQLNSDNNANQLALIGLHAQIRNYKELLSKPMEEIAAANGDFKATFEKQQEIIADWIVSQKAFRELAYEFGEKLGLSQDEVRAQVKDKKKDVLNNTTKYGNNASSSINQFELSESTIQKQKEKAGM